MEGKAESLLDILYDFGMLPDGLEKQILEEKDLKKLTKWIKIAAKSSTIEEFIDNM